MEIFSLREPLSALTHGLWALLAMPATVVLWQQSRGDLAKRLTLLVFGLSLAGCYASSTLFHGVRLSADQLAWFDSLDHAGIYLLIAGSYTPLAYNLLRGRWRWGVLATAWLAAAAGSAWSLTHGAQSLRFSTGIYLVLGWGAYPCYVQVAKVLSHRVVRPLLIGGVLYTIGGLLNFLPWPPVWSGVVRAHDVFHLWVMAGSFAHYWFMLRVVAPLPRVEHVYPGIASQLVAAPVARG